MKHAFGSSHDIFFYLMEKKRNKEKSRKIFPQSANMAPLCSAWFYYCWTQTDIAILFSCQTTKMPTKVFFSSSLAKQPLNISVSTSELFFTRSPRPANKRMRVTNGDRFKVLIASHERGYLEMFTFRSEHSWSLSFIMALFFD